MVALVFNDKVYKLLKIKALALVQGLFSLSSVTFFVHVLNADMLHLLAVLVGFCPLSPIKAAFLSCCAYAYVRPKVGNEW